MTKDGPSAIPQPKYGENYAPSSLAAVGRVAVLSHPLLNSANNPEGKSGGLRAAALAGERHHHALVEAYTQIARPMIGDPAATIQRTVVDVLTVLQPAVDAWKQFVDRMGMQHAIEEAVHSAPIVIFANAAWFTVPEACAYLNERLAAREQ